jgi:hypothetical protein
MSVLPLKANIRQRIEHVLEVITRPYGSGGWNP